METVLRTFMIFSADLAPHIADKGFMLSTDERCPEHVMLEVEREAAVEFIGTVIEPLISKHKTQSVVMVFNVEVPTKENFPPEEDFDRCSHGHAWETFCENGGVEMINTPKALIGTLRNLVSHVQTAQAIEEARGQTLQ